MEEELWSCSTLRAVMVKGLDTDVMATSKLIMGQDL